MVNPTLIAVDINNITVWPVTAKYDGYFFCYGTLESEATFIAKTRLRVYGNLLKVC